MTIAHVGGLPFEEWLPPLLATGGGIAVALRATLRRPPLGRHRRRRWVRS